VKSLISRRVGKLIERAGEFESSPAIHDHEHGQSSEPDGLNLQGHKNESCGAHEAENRRHHQAVGTSHHKPKHRSQDLAAVERVDGQKVEKQQEKIHIQDRKKEHVCVGHCLGPSERSIEPEERRQNLNQRHID
jgi:hypothetical protein